MQKLNRSSFIWNFFDEKPESNRTAICKICGAVLSYKSTSHNLKKHMQRKHPTIALNKPPTDQKAETLVFVVTNSADEHEHDGMEVDAEYPDNIENKNEPHRASETQMFEACDSRMIEASESSSHQKAEQITQLVKNEKVISTKKLSKKNSVGREKIDKALLRMFFLDLQPISIVKDEGFREFVTALYPTYQLPSPEEISETLLVAEYEAVHKKIKKIIKNVKSVTLTTDCWTSPTAEHFLSITAHFINDNFEAKHVMIGCEPLGEMDISSNVANIISSTIAEWNLENKVLIIISDDSENIKATIAEIGFAHFGCYAHTINAIVQDSLGIGRPTLAKVQSIIRFFNSASAIYIVNKQLEELKTHLTTELIRDVPDRWDAAAYMIKRVLDFEEQLRTMAFIEHEFEISPEEWQFLKELVVILKPLDDVTAIMSSENYVAASSMIILTDGIQDVYRELSGGNYGKLAKSVINAILDGISCLLRSLESNDLLVLTTFLDPRFKNIAFSNDQVTQTVKDAIIALTGNIKVTLSDATQTQEPCKATIKSETEIERSIWSNFDRKKATIRSTISAQPKVLIEFQIYLDEAPIARNEDPLLWWKQNSNNFPFLSKIFQEKFVAVATSVPCERLFTEFGAKASDRRGKISGADGKKLLFLHYNKELID